MRGRDVLNYTGAALLLLASVPLYRCIIARATRPDSPAPVVVLNTARPQLPSGAPGTVTRDAHGDYVLHGDCWTDRARGDCAYVTEASVALDQHKARCLGGRVYVVKQERGVTVIRDWPHRVTCSY